MKHRLMLIIAALFAILTVSSCQKDNTPSLNGTKWAAGSNGEQIILTFYSSEAVMEFFENGTATVTVEYQYRYEHEGQRVYMTSTSYMYADLYGTIKENTMTITNTSTGKVIGLLIKV